MKALLAAAVDALMIEMALAQMGAPRKKPGLKKLRAVSKTPRGRAVMRQRVMRQRVMR